jgi:hypothetical protein
MARSTKIAFENRDKYIALGLNIAYYRKREGMTQEQLNQKEDVQENKDAQSIEDLFKAPAPGAPKGK